MTSILIMISVQEAEHIILSRKKDFGTERVPFERSLGRVLAAGIQADRDLPACNRATMDGIAVRQEDISHYKKLTIAGVQAAGDPPLAGTAPGECIEIMTGAALPPAFDSVVPYEDITIENGHAMVTVTAIKKGQNVHVRASDRKKGDMITEGGPITPALIGIAASLGALELEVKKWPRIAVLSSGNELVEVANTPLDWEVRRSNNQLMLSVLEKNGMAADTFHLPDDRAVILEQLEKCLDRYQVLLLSGGVSKGKFDHLPAVLEELEVKQWFHRVRQKPGKPFWFGEGRAGQLVFAFPGNPVSTFLCLHRYFLPWLQASLGLEHKANYAALDSDIAVPFPLTYFLQVSLEPRPDGMQWARPLAGNGSGDFANLAQAQAFMELPAERDNFNKGEVFPIWTI